MNIENPYTPMEDREKFLASPETGVKSYIYFKSNRRFWEKMHEVFECSEREKIIGINITEQGIGATFKNK